MNIKHYKRHLKIAGIALFVVFCLLFLWSVYTPKSVSESPSVYYNIETGTGSKDIAKDLKDRGVIKSSLFFKFYVLISGQHANLQAGIYDFSGSMSIAKIVNKLVRGDIAKNKITIMSGWTLEDMGKYFEGRKIYSKKDFLQATKKDYSKDFAFLDQKPKNTSLEGYIFPDTYYVPLIFSPEQFVKMALGNLDKKLTPEFKKKIEKDKKSIHQIIIMASIIEKEVPSLEDKKIVSGILWKRMLNDMPLQVDSTVNYVTGKNDIRVAIKDTKIDSLYNTYKYKGLPLGPISNPGMDSILAAIYPTKSEYWFYLSAKGTGKTIYSATFKEHTVATRKYLN